MWSPKCQSMLNRIQFIVFCKDAFNFVLWLTVKSQYCSINARRICKKLEILDKTFKCKNTMSLFFVA